MPNDFRYDVAFSFLARDEPLGTQLNAALSDRYRTFIYSEHQKELAGRDGQQAFSEVYEREAGVVVVLYRPGWGETNWTRVEKNAIQSRSFEQSYEDFAFFIQLDETGDRPAWVPKRVLWYGLERFGIAGASATIDARIQHLGQTPRVLTLAEKAQAHKSRMDFEAARDAFTQSEAGVAAANKAGEELNDLLIAKSAELARHGVALTPKQSRGWFELFSSPMVMFIDINGFYANRLEKPRLKVEITEGRPQERGGYRAEARSCERIDISYELLAPNRSGWTISINDQGRELSSDQLADHLIERFLANYEKVQTRRNRSR